MHAVTPAPSRCSARRPPCGRAAGRVAAVEHAAARRRSMPRPPSPTSTLLKLTIDSTPPGAEIYFERRRYRQEDAGDADGAAREGARRTCGSSCTATSTPSSRMSRSTAATRSRESVTLKVYHGDAAGDGHAYRQLGKGSGKHAGNDDTGLERLNSLKGTVMRIKTLCVRVRCSCRRWRWRSRRRPTIGTRKARPSTTSATSTRPPTRSSRASRSRPSRARRPAYLYNVAQAYRQGARCKRRAVLLQALPRRSRTRTRRSRSAEKRDRDRAADQGARRLREAAGRERVSKPPNTTLPAEGNGSAASTNTITNTTDRHGHGSATTVVAQTGGAATTRAATPVKTSRRRPP